MTLSSFHNAGISTVSSQLAGFPRAKELMGVSKKPKAPGMVIYFNQDIAESKEMVHKISSHIKHTTFKEIINKIDVYYDPNPKAKNSFMEKDNISDAFHHHKGTRRGCSSDINGLPWLIKIELNKEKMLEKEINILEINSKFCSWWEKKFNDNKSMKKDEKKIITKITQLAVLSNTDNDEQPIIHIRFNAKDLEKDKFDLSSIKNFIKYIIKPFKLKGLSNVTDISAIKQEKKVTFDKNSGGVVTKDEYVTYTAGVNLKDIKYITGIDLNRTISNNVVEIYNNYGIEITRSILLREFSNAYERAGGEVNYQHVAMMVDQMTSSGQINSIDRHGMNKSENDHNKYFN
jgi:DNA-directed RNA polymerase II subunit RPB1